MSRPLESTALDTSLLAGDSLNMAMRNIPQDVLVYAKSLREAIVARLKEYNVASLAEFVQLCETKRPEVLTDGAHITRLLGKLHTMLETGQLPSDMRMDWRNAVSEKKYQSPDHYTASLDCAGNGDLVIEGKPFWPAVYLLDAGDKQLKATTPRQMSFHDVIGVCFDGRVIAQWEHPDNMSPAGLALWDPKTPKDWKDLEIEANGVFGFDAANEQIIQIIPESSALRIFDEYGLLMSTALIPDGTFDVEDTLLSVVGVTPDNLIVVRDGSKICLLDLKTGMRVDQVGVYGDTFKNTIILPDGDIIFGSMDEDTLEWKLHLWRREEWGNAFRALAPLKTRGSPPAALACDPTGKHVFVYDCHLRKNQFMVIDAKTGEVESEVTVTLGDERPVRSCMAVSPSGLVYVADFRNVFQLQGEIVWD